MATGSFRGRPPRPVVRPFCTRCKRNRAMAGKKMCPGCIKLSPKAQAQGAREDARQGTGMRSTGTGRR